MSEKLITLDNLQEFKTKLDQQNNAAYYGKSQADSLFGATLELSINTTTYVLTALLKNRNGNVLSTQTVDLPLESIITSATYYDSYTYGGTTYTNVIVLVLATTSVPTIIPLGDLISGLATTQDLQAKQDTLVSGTNIKTINGESILGSGNIVVEGGGGTGDGVIEKTGAELENMTYEEGQLYYCTSASDSFSADQLYMGTGSNSIVKFTQTSVSTTPAITSFTISPTTTELGNTRNCTYSYTLKKYSAISNVKLDGTVIDASPSSANGSGTAATAYDSHTFTLSASYTGGTLSKTASISPIYRQFYGYVSGDSVSQVLTNLKDVTSDTNALKTVLSNSLPSSVSLSLGSTPVYVYLVVKSTLSINTLKSGGFDVPYTLVATQSFTNHYNASYNVKVYRTDNKVFGDMVMNINS